jgi:hypothetical protein
MIEAEYPDILEFNDCITTFKLFDFSKKIFYCGDSNLKLSGKYINKTIDSKKKSIPIDFESNRLILISKKHFEIFKKMSFRELSKWNRKDFLIKWGYFEWAI